MASKIKSLNHNNNKTSKQSSFKHSFLKTHNYSNLNEEITYEKKYKESCEDESFEIFCEYFQEQPMNKIESQQSFTSFHDFRQHKNQIDPFNITPIFERISSKIDENNHFKLPNGVQLCNNLFPKYIKKLQFESVKSQQYQYPTWNKKQLQTNRFKRSKTKNISINQYKTNQYVNHHHENEIQLNRQKKNGDRSLKTLAISVLKIVQYYSKTTYKDIAEKLVSDMLQQGLIPNDRNVKSQLTQSKNISNAKRRVYDALNVLISVNALQKQGKFISSQRCQYTQYNKLKQQAKKRKKQLHLKIWKLSELYKKYISVKKFISRNKNEDSSSQLRIQLPFVFVTYPKSNQIHLQLSNSLMRVQMNKSFKVWGDVQMISRLNIQKHFQSIQNTGQMVQIQEYIHTLKEHQNIF